METPSIMSLATSLKEISDILNQISTVNELNDSFPYLLFLQEFFVFSIKNLLGAVIYIFSFSWLRDFSYLPLLAPQLNPSSYFEDSYFENPLSHFFSFSKVPSIGTSGYGTDQLISGFINSFFFSFPFSLPHFISMRRFLSQGFSAGVSSVTGTIAAHSLFLVGVIYGLRFLIIPWFSVEPLNYIVGILIVVAIINELVQEKKVYVITRSKNRQVNLLKIGALNFMLTWCEESTVFHSFNHLTLNAQNTYLDLYPSGPALGIGALNSFLIHTTYLLAFILGNCFFSFLFYFIFLQSTQYISQWTGLAIAKVARTLNKVVLLFIIAFGLSSFPYYGLDYLLGKVGGFLPEDPVYTNTKFFSPPLMKTASTDLDVDDAQEKKPKQKEENKSEERVASFDANYFDQGVYLGVEDRSRIDITTDFLSNALALKNNPTILEEDLPKMSIEPTNTFEDLNYRGEYAWTFHANYKKPVVKKGFLAELGAGQSLTKPRNHYLELKRKSDQKKAEAAIQAADRIPLGHVSDWKEGVLPEVEQRSTSQKDLAKAKHGFAEANRGTFREAPLKNQMGNFMGQPLSPVKNREPDTEEIMKNSLLNQDSNDNPLEEYVTDATTFTRSPEEDDVEVDRLSIPNLIKTKYVFNPVYRTLLKTDIDAFLARQPSNHNLAANQEYSLAKKRQLLERYYNWLRYYSPFEKELEELYKIPQTKSFVDSVYHQQFKGTLDVVQRLFSVTFNKDRVLSYDQTLYADTTADALDQNPFLHEQLFLDKRLSSQTRGQARNKVNSKPGNTRGNPSTDEAFITGSHSNGAREPIARPFKGENQIQSITNFEDLENSKDGESIGTNADTKLENEEFEINRLPFIEESNSSPVYAGWDDVSRQFVVTNRFTLK